MKQISLRTKLVAHSTLLVLAAGTGVGVSLYFAERQYLVRRFDQTQEDNVTSLVQIRRESVTSNNEQLLLSYLSLLRRSKALSYAMIQDVTGRVLSHTNPAFVGQRLSDPLTLGALEAGALLRQRGGSTDDVIDLALPILHGTKRMGVARVGYSRATMAQLVDQTLLAARHRILIATFLAMGFGVALAVGLSLLFTKPIELLRSGAQIIGEGVARAIRIAGEGAGDCAALHDGEDRAARDSVMEVVHQIHLQRPGHGDNARGIDAVISAALGGATEVDDRGG